MPEAPDAGRSADRQEIADELKRIDRGEIPRNPHKVWLLLQSAIQLGAFAATRFIDFRDFFHDRHDRKDCSSLLRGALNSLPDTFSRVAVNRQPLIVPGFTTYASPARLTVSLQAIATFLEAEATAAKAEERQLRVDKGKNKSTPTATTDHTQLFAAILTRNRKSLDTGTATVASLARKYADEFEPRDTEKREKVFRAVQAYGYRWNRKRKSQD